MCGAAVPPRNPWKGPQRRPPNLICPFFGGYLAQLRQVGCSLWSLVTCRRRAALPQPARQPAHQLLAERPQLRWLFLHNIDTEGADLDAAMLGRPLPAPLPREDAAPQDRVGVPQGLARGPCGSRSTSRVLCRRGVPWVSHVRTALLRIRPRALHKVHAQVAHDSAPSPSSAASAPGSTTTCTCTYA